MQGRTKKWWQYLLLIPGCLVVDLFVIIGSVAFDTYIANGEQGHPAPFMTLIMLFVFGIITFIVIILALILCIRSIVREKQNPGVAQAPYNAPYMPLPIVPKKKKIWHCFIPLLVQVPISIALVIWCGSYEINNFYSDPSHIGFAVPVMTFMMVVIMLGVTVAVLAICIIWAVVRANRNKERGGNGQTLSTPGTLE